MRPIRLLLPVLVASAALVACGPSTELADGADDGASDSYTGVPEDPTFGPGDYCAETIVIVQPDIRTNFSLASENYRNEDYCAAYPYLQAVIAEDPLYTGGDPEARDRNYQRLASVYEAFAAEVDSTDQATQKAYLDSAVTARQTAIQTMDAEGVEYDPFLRDLREGFFYYQYADFYEDSEERQFEAFSRALEAQPDSLEDWYLSRLFEGSALEYGVETPNPDRAEFVQRLAAVADDQELADSYAAYAEFLVAEPVAGAVTVDDAVVRGFISDLRGGTIADDDALSLLAVVIQQPERIEALDEDVAEIRSLVLRLPVIEEQIDNPRTLVALAFQRFRDGETSEGNRLFDRALENAESNLQRADFLYSRATAGFGNASQLINRALQLYPQHGPSLYRRASFIADAVGRPRSLEGRFAFWCLADIYRNVAAQTTNAQIARLARTAAGRYEAAAPTREQYFLEGYSPGQSVSASLGAYGSCTTRVR
jgi:hypothetical protein